MSGGVYGGDEASAFTFFESYNTHDSFLSYDEEGSASNLTTCNHDKVVELGVIHAGNEKT